MIRHLLVLLPETVCGLHVRGFDEMVTQQSTTDMLSAVTNRSHSGSRSFPAWFNHVARWTRLSYSSLTGLLKRILLWDSFCGDRFTN
jgi:hypothetical protein